MEHYTLVKKDTMKIIREAFACFFLFHISDIDGKTPQLMFIGVFVASKVDMKIVFIFSTYVYG